MKTLEMARPDGTSKGRGPPNSQARAERLVEGHLDVLRRTLVQTLAAQFDEMESAWEARLRELREENNRLRSEPNIRPQMPMVIEEQPILAPAPQLISPLPHQGEENIESEGRSADGSSKRTSYSSEGRRSLRQKTEARKWDTRFMTGCFEDLDVDHTGVVKISALREKLLPSVRKKDLTWFEQFPSFVIAHRAAHPLLWQGLREDEISYAVLKHIMLSDTEELDAPHQRVLNAWRHACIHHASLDMVLRTAAVTRDEFKGDDAYLKAANRMWWLESTICVVIIVNAAIIGLSLDVAPDSPAWEIAELMCTACFVLELLVKLRASGASVHFFGDDWHWNVFDFLLVVFAVADLAVSLYFEVTGDQVLSTASLRDWSVLRLLRLLRVARLARLLRIRHMKELILMASGIVGGLRTLCWAIVMLFFFVYVFGIMTHQFMKDWKKVNTCGDEAANCSEYAKILYDDYSPLFGDLFKTCFTVIRCVTGDCNSHSGTPLAPIISETHGKLAVAAYVGGVLFVTICVFNLLMAIFVENTLDYAQQDNEKKQYIRLQESIQRAHKLQELVDKILFHAPAPPCGQMPWLMKYLPKKNGTSSDASAESACEVRIPTNFQVTRDSFDAALDDLDDLLDCLDVNIPDPSKLFDILDADGDGKLHIHEIVDGIMRLRGPAHKSDIVANGLMIRSVQRSLEEMRMALQPLQSMLGSRVQAQSTIQHSRVLCEREL